MHKQCNKQTKQITKTSNNTKNICCTNKCKKAFKTCNQWQTIVKHVQTCNTHSKQMTNTSKNQNQYVVQTNEQSIQQM